MQGTSFVVLTGHLNDYPLANLIGILRRQRKTGRLLIEYQAAPCSLYFDEGNLVDAQLNTLSGLQAIYVAMSQPAASFNFNPLIQPPRRSIDDPAQKVLMESLGCWEEKVINVQARAKDERIPLETAPTATAPAPLEARNAELPEPVERLALPAAAPAPQTFLKSEVFAASAIILALLSLLAVVALKGERPMRDDRARAPRINLREGAPLSEELADEGVRTVEVVVQIENGRVSKAFVANPQAGMEAYQALALRIARGRRYPAGTTAQKSVSVEIKQPGQ